MPSRFDCSVITSLYSRDALLAPLGELREAVLLDLLLRVQTEGPFDADLDPEALAVEAVLVALVEAAHGLVALEDVLERPPPAVVRGHRVVRGDRPVDERPLRAAPVPLPKLLEGALPLPEVEDLELEGVAVGDGGERLEARHGLDCRGALADAHAGNNPSYACV